MSHLAHTRTLKSRDSYRYITLALAGVYAEGVCADGRSTFSASGCRERTLEEFVSNADRPIAEGAWVIDKREAIARHGAKSVFRSPLPDISGHQSGPSPDISPGASIIADALSTDPSNGFGALVLGARSGAVCLDTVGMVEYAAYWRNLGAKVGRVYGGVIVWE